MRISHTLLFAAALLVGLPSMDALADKGSRSQRRYDPLKYKKTYKAKSTRSKGKLRARGGMASRYKAWKRRNLRVKKVAPKQGSVTSRTVKRRGSRSTRVWKKRSYERRGTRTSRNRVRYRVSGKRFSRSTIATLIRAGLIRRGKGGSLYVLGSRKYKRGSRKYRPAKRLRLFSGRRATRGDLKRLWKLASRTNPARYPHGNIPLAKLWRK